MTTSKQMRERSMVVDSSNEPGLYRIQCCTVS